VTSAAAGGAVAVVAAKTPPLRKATKTISSPSGRGARANTPNT
jgi:hypothetical protein